MSNFNKTSMRVTLEVDLGKIKHNIKKVCELVAPSKVTAVVNPTLKFEVRHFSCFKAD